MTLRFRGQKLNRDLSSLLVSLYRMTQRALDQVQDNEVVILTSWDAPESGEGVYHRAIVVPRERGDRVHVEDWHDGYRRDEFVNIGRYLDFTQLNRLYHERCQYNPAASYRALPQGSRLWDGYHWVERNRLEYMW